MVFLQLSDYSELLTNFLNPRVRALPEDATKRAEALIRFLRNLRYVSCNSVDQSRQVYSLVSRQTGKCIGRDLNFSP